MGRLPDEWIDRIKTDIPIRDLVEAAGVELKRQGGNWVGLCPFHDDKEPSLVVTPVKNLWHCLGACQSGGSPIDWVMKSEGKSFRDAVLALKDRYLPHLKNETDLLPINSDMDDQTLLRAVVDYYHQTLKEKSEARDFLRFRGIDSEEAIDTFKLGFANRSLCFRLPERGTEEGDAMRERLCSLSIYRKQTGHEHFNGALVFPVIDEAGQITEIYGRKIGRNLRKGTIHHLYMDRLSVVGSGLSVEERRSGDSSSAGLGRHRGVWNIAGLKEDKAHSGELILCESLIDALTFWVNGFRNVTASYGTNGFTPDHLAAFKSHDVKRVLLAYDADDAGDQAAMKLAEQLIAEGFACYRIAFPRGQDANSVVTKQKGELADYVANAAWLGPGPKPSLSHETFSLHHESTGTAAKRKKQLKTKPDSADQPPTTQNSLSADLSSVALAKGEALAKGGQPTTIPVERHGPDITISFDNRTYRIRGLEKNQSYDQLKVNVLVRHGEDFHADHLELYSDYHRTRFIKRVSEELHLPVDLIQKDVGRIFFKLEELQHQQIQETLAPKETEVSLSEREHQEAMSLLRDPRLVDRILADFDTCGLVGEETNKLIGYLAAVSRKLLRPLAIIIQSSSSAGKTTLMEAVLRFMPEEEQIKYSALTGQALFYMGEKDLKHKILAVVEEEGSERASYSLKLLQSEGELRIASTGKDPKTGKMETKEYHVEGPVMILLTTTAVDMDEELLNRCLVISVNEGRLQTQRIHQLQREQETVEGFLTARKASNITKLHQNAQRLLQPIHVFNPFARHLTFLSDKTRMRRDHTKYLVLIKAITLLHQHQRTPKTLELENQTLTYIETTLQDIALANKLASEAFGRTLDELSPQTRQLLDHLLTLVGHGCKHDNVPWHEYRFSRKDVRDHTGWSDYQVRSHMKKLVDLEYVLTHRGMRGQTFVYELIYMDEGVNGKPFLMGLIDPKKLEKNYDSKFEHINKENEHLIAQFEHASPQERASIEHPTSPHRAWVEHRTTPVSP